MRSISLGLLVVLLSTTGCYKERRSDKAGEKMQQFVQNISSYARNIDSDFIVIPQNGPELAFNNLAPGDGLYGEYLKAISGFGIEELFYNGAYSLEQERLDMLKELVVERPVFVAEYVNSNSLVDDAISHNAEYGFLCFPRVQSNYDYEQIPQSITGENSDDILVLGDAQNYLYLISTGRFSSEQDMVDQISETNFDLIIIDLFFDEEQLTKSQVQQLKTKANGGERIVIAYMNIGSAEKYRYYWKDYWVLHHPVWLRKKYDGYSDEIWVAYWNQTWQDIIYGNDDSYTHKVISAGFDGVYLDNVEAYYFLYYK